MSGIPNSLDTQGYSADEIPASTSPEVSNYEETGLSRIAVALPTNEVMPEELDGGRPKGDEEVPREVNDVSPGEEGVDVEPITDPIKPFDLKDPEPELDLEPEDDLSETGNEELPASKSSEPGEHSLLEAVNEDERFLEIKRKLVKELISDPMSLVLTVQDLDAEMEKIFGEVDRSFLENFLQAREVVPKVLVLDSGDIETIAQEELVSPYLLRMNVYEVAFKDGTTKYNGLGMRTALCLAASAYESSKILDDKNAAESLFSNLSKEKYLRPLLSPQGLTSEQKQSLMNSAKENIGDAETLDKVLGVFLERADRMHLIRESN